MPNKRDSRNELRSNMNQPQMLGALSFPQFYRGMGGIA
jgi:hypothetical protein